MSLRVLLMATRYCRELGRFYWHTSDECPDWPKRKIIQTYDKPPKNELCAFCANAEDDSSAERGSKPET